MSKPVSPMGRLYLGPLRVILRRAGIGRALGLLGALRSLRYRLRFAVTRPESVVVRLTSLTARFPVFSASELQRVSDLGGEARVLRRLIREARPGDVAYDIGTNVGIFAVFLGKAVGETGRVIGFEPESRSYDRCTQALAMNSLTNVRVFDVALGDEERETLLVLAEEPSSGVHHVLRDGRDVGASDSWRASAPPVRVVVGDRFVSERRLPVPNLVKIDVEGMELEVVRGLFATLKRPECRLVCCEVHFAISEQVGRPEAPRRLVEMLDEAGFGRIEWPDPSHLFAFKERARTGEAA